MKKKNDAVVQFISLPDKVKQKTWEEYITGEILSLIPSKIATIHDMSETHFNLNYNKIQNYL